jgi:ABC-2 type transport system ATP-binding protein
MPQSDKALHHLQVDEILYFTAHLRGYSRHDAQRERDRLIELLDLSSIRHRTAMGLSGGQRRLVLLATTLAAARPVMILDEPANDLDPQKRRFVWDILRRQRADFSTTVLLVTHNIVEAEPIIDRLAIMASGRLLKLGRLGDLKAPLRAQLKLELRFAAGSLPQLPADGYILMQDTGRLEMLIPQEQAASIIDALTCQPNIEDFVLRPPTLEDLYLNTLSEE